MTPVRTIPEVIERLDEIIARSISDNDRLGVFASLYRQTTIKVSEGISNGRFRDGKLMEQLDVTFANRYFEALDLFRAGKQPSACWRLSFQAALTSRPAIFLPLILGMNAHINFDLGIAAAQTCLSAQLPHFKHDFDEINNILAEMVARVRYDIRDLWLSVAALDSVDTRINDAIVNFCMRQARARAWRVALKLASLGATEWNEELQKLDREATVIARLLYNPFTRTTSRSRQITGKRRKRSDERIF